MIKLLLLVCMFRFSVGIMRRSFIESSGQVLSPSFHTLTKNSLCIFLFPLSFTQSEKINDQQREPPQPNKLTTDNFVSTSKRPRLNGRQLCLVLRAHVSIPFRTAHYRLLVEPYLQKTDSSFSSLKYLDFTCQYWRRPFS